MSYNDDEILCTRCEYIKQTESCCICSHPEQTDEKLKGYVYAGDKCDLFKRQPKAFHIKCSVKNSNNLSIGEGPMSHLFKEIKDGEYEMVGSNYLTITGEGTITIHKITPIYE